MLKITFLLNCKLENRLRNFTKRKGDLSRILNEAVEMWLNQNESVVPNSTKGDEKYENKS